MSDPAKGVSVPDDSHQQLYVAAAGPVGDAAAVHQPRSTNSAFSKLAPPSLRLFHRALQEGMKVVSRAAREELAKRESSTLD
jgi:hypothetical protein